MARKCFTVTVFGGASVLRDSPEWQIAHELGRLLGEAGYLVCNGGYGGSMEAVAEGVKEADGRTAGITTKQFPSARTNPFIDEEIRKDTWGDRLLGLIGRGDLFVILNGGTGTLAELAAVWEMLNKSLIKKPVILLGSRMQEIYKWICSQPDMQANPLIHAVESPGKALQLIEKLAAS